MKIHTLILALLVLVVGACKKYSEDPFISLRKPNVRLGGTNSSGGKDCSWKLKSYLINGAEHIEDFKVPASFGEENYPPVVTFIYNRGVGDYGSNMYGSGGWHINNSEKYNYLHIYLGGGGPPSGQTWPYIFYHDNNYKNFDMGSIWLIKRLYGKKMHLIQYTNNNTYELFFEKQ